ncbi:MAG TPA: hypothetical protein ENN69_01415 [Spirochaetia bacterium]|nr:hypothetical protein [Spirochaetia bacterium]
MTTNDLKKRLCETVELYVDNPELFYELFRDRIFELSLSWSAEVFLGALKTCCERAALPFFFSQDPENWRDIYLSSRDNTHGNRSERTYGSAIELASEKPETRDEERRRIIRFLRNLKEACENGRIRELCHAPSRVA